MKSLYQDVDMTTMRRMREEEGMSNGEIANALGVSRETVWKYLGSGPRKKYTRRNADQPDPFRQTLIAKPIGELFSEVKPQITLHGKEFTYVVYPDQQEVKVGLPLIDAKILDAEALATFIEELQYILRMYMR